jgi:hypothetical protein
MDYIGQNNGQRNTNQNGHVQNEILVKLDKEAKRFFLSKFSNKKNHDFL